MSIIRNPMISMACLFTLVSPAFANISAISPAMVEQDIFAQAQKNNDWKQAVATGQQAQVVFMSVSPATNPNNEVGMETHTFDQVIFVVEGHGNAVLNGKTSAIQKGDMIFIPLGTAHNVVNLNKDKPLKIISVYSNTDIPAGSVYPKKTD